MSAGRDTLVAAFEAICDERGDAVAVIASGLETTYRELRENARPWARALRALGVTKGDRVAVLLPNTIEWLYLDLAIARAGGIVVPVNGRYRPAELEKFLRAAAPRILFATDSFLTNRYLERLAEVIPELVTEKPGEWRSAHFPSLEAVVAMGQERLPGMLPRELFLAAAESGEARDALVSPRDPAFIFYTSGSTGEPKGVVAPQDAVVNLRAYAKAQGMTPDDRMLCPMPLYYIGGHFVSFLTPLLNGATVVLGQTFDLDEVIGLTLEHRVTFFGHTPPTFTQMMHHPALAGRTLDSVRVAFVAGSAFSHGQLEQWSKRLGIPRFLGGFGMTETLGGASSTSPDDPLEIVGTTVGRPIEGFEFELRDPETQTATPRGEPGELWVRGRIMLGYHGMSEAELRESVAPDGWFRTGDLLLERPDGRYTYVARLKDLIKVRGENVSAPQVEAELARHPEIVEAAVVGVPDEARGEAVVAYVQRADGSALSPEALRAWCKERMAPHKVPLHVRWIDRAESWPRTPSAKVAKTVLRASFTLVAALVFAVFGVAGAQETEAPSRTIEEIVVTAQKKTESIQEVPISISALTGDFMRSAAIDDVAEIAHHTPNVYFQENGPAGSAIFIRGFGTPFALSSLDPGVSLVLDELSIPRDVYLSDPLYDLERFEVLRGPQGTLFGKNTPAGLFNLTTKRPTREWTGSIQARVGGLDTHRIEAGIGGPLGPLGEVAQIRLAILESDGINDTENTTIPGEEPTDAEQRAGRISLALQPLEKLDVLVIGSRAETDAPRNYAWQQRLLRPSAEDFLRQYDPEIEDDPFDHQISQNAPGDTFRDADLVQANLRYAIGDLGPAKNLEAVAILGQTEFDQGFKSDLDMSPADLLNLPDAAFHYEQRSVELRLSGELAAPASWGTLEVIVGGLLFDSEFSSQTSVIAGEDFDAYLLSAPAFELLTGSEPPGGIGFQTLQAAAAALGVTLPPDGLPDPIAGDGFFIRAAQEMQSQAVFGQVAWRPTEQWTLSVGARANFEDKNADFFLDCGTPGLACAAAGGSDYTAAPERSESDVSPKVSLQYFPWESLSLFATYAQGYKSGGFNNLALNPAGIEVEPEKTESYEAGAKGTLFSDTLSYGLTLFWMEVDDLQLQNFISSTVVLVRNAASARSRGIELDFQWLTPWEPLSIRAAGALTDAEFVDYPNAPAPRGTGTNTDLSGERLPYSPQQHLSATPELRFPFSMPALPFLGTRDLVFGSALDVQYFGDLYLDGDLDPNVRQDAYLLLNGRLSLRNADETLALGLGVENLTDNDVMTFTTDSTLFPGAYMGSQQVQRNWYLELRYAW